MTRSWIRDVLWFHLPQFIYGPNSTISTGEFESSGFSIKRFNSDELLEVQVMLGKIMTRMKRKWRKREEMGENES